MNNKIHKDISDICGDIKHCLDKIFKCMKTSEYELKKQKLPDITSYCVIEVRIDAEFLFTPFELSPLEK